MQKGVMLLYEGVVVLDTVFRGIYIIETGEQVFKLSGKEAFGCSAIIIWMLNFNGGKVL